MPWQDAVQAGSVMATKLLSNEFVAMQALGKLSDLSEHAKGVTSVFLVSFANFLLVLFQVRLNHLMTKKEIQLPALV